MSKRLTPLQELINTLERHKKLCKGANDFNKSWGIEIAIQEARLLLPKEQQLLSDTWDAATERKWQDLKIEHYALTKDQYLSQFKQD